MPSRTTPGIQGSPMKSLLLAMLCLGFVSSSRAQTTASIFGTVSDSTGGAIIGATVRVKNLETGSLRVLTADEAGRYNAPFLEVGVYEVHAESAGFQPEVRTGINLVVGQQAEVNLTLSLGQLREAVVVREDSPLVSVTTQDISGLVGERAVKVLPLNGRSYDQLLTLNPGVVNYTSQRAGGIGTSNSVVYQCLRDQQHAGWSQWSAPRCGRRP